MCHMATWATIQFCHDELGITHDSICDWNNFMSEVAASALLRNPCHIGGLGTIIEVDESVFVRRKCSRCHSPMQQRVIGVCRETGVLLYATEDRTQATIEKVITDSLLPSSTIIIDCFASYNRPAELPGCNYTHQSANH